MLSDITAFLLLILDGEKESGPKYNLSARHGLHLMNHWSRWSQEPSTSTLQAIANALSYSPELGGKTLSLMRPPHNFSHRPGEIRLVLTWKIHPYWLAFMVLEGAV